MKLLFDKVLLFEPTTYEDERGYFFESYNKEISKYIGKKFVQDNISCSKKNVLRGLHYQWFPPMGKLIRVIRGFAIDCIVDIREDSKFYGQYEFVELSEYNKKSLWVPAGFAHGFLSMEEDTTFLYKCTEYYNKDHEGCINPFDRELKIKWPLNKESLKISKRDEFGISFENYSLNKKFRI